MDLKNRTRMVELLTKGLTVDELAELVNLLLEERYDWYDQKIVQKIDDIYKNTKPRDFTLGPG